MRKAILSCLMVLVVFLTACNRNRKFVKITDHLTWAYTDETESSLLWDQKVVVGPGSITLKCGKIYAWGMIHKKNVSTFFMLNLKTGEIIKNPEMRDVVHKYNVNVDLDQSYTQAEIFGDQKSMLSIKRLEDDIKMLNEKKVMPRTLSADVFSGQHCNTKCRCPKTTNAMMFFSLRLIRSGGFASA